MQIFKFGTSEFLFPCWGALAIQMAHEAGFSGMQLSDAGGYLQPHPQNNGYIEYERYGLDLRRKDSFPLLSKWVQEDYLEAADACRVELISIYLYTLEHQGFIKYSKNTPQGEQCRESIQNGILAAAQMGIPLVTIAAKGLFGTAQNQYALEAMKYAVEVADEHGIRIAVSSDLPLRAQLQLIQEFDGRLKVAFDTCAPLVYGTGIPADQIRGLGKRPVEYFQMRDFRLDAEGFVPSESASVAFLGQGGTRFEDAVRAVQDIGYSGWIMSGTPYYHPDIQTDGKDYVLLAKQDVHTLQTVFQSDNKSTGER